MSNYPDGMRSRDWAYIDGDEHHEQCPQHEDSDCDESDCKCDQYELTAGDIALENAGL